MLSLHAKRGAATASALHVRILKLEPSALEGFDVIDDAAIQVHHRSGVDEYFQPLHIEGLVHHSSRVFKLHGVGEAGAAAADDPDTQTSGNGILLSHDFSHLGNSAGGKRNRRSLFYLRNVGIHLGDGSCGHCYLLALNSLLIIAKVASADRLGRLRALSVCALANSMPGRRVRIPARSLPTGL